MSRNSCSTSSSTTATCTAPSACRVRSDRWITLPSVVLILLSGIALAVRARLPVLGTGWLLWASVAFSVSGILFGVRVGPLQKRIRDFAAVASGADDWPRFTRFYRQWKVFGVLSVGAAAVAFLLMVLKPELPGF